MENGVTLARAVPEPCSDARSACLLGVCIAPVPRAPRQCSLSPIDDSCMITEFGKVPPA